MRQVDHHQTAIHETEPEAPDNVRAERAVVLLVDDQAIIGEAIRRLLQDQPEIDYHYCSSGSQALDAAERIKPTVILQDLVMPDVDGLTLLTRYRASSTTRDVPVIVLSSKEDPAIKRDAFQGGANDYLVKLPDKIELVARIHLHSKAYTTHTELAERIQELQAVRDELSRLVSTDSLTGLYSRAKWFELAAAEFSRHRRHHRPVAFLMIDLDFFKRINDTWGHDIGDEVLRQFASVLRAASVRQSDFAGRLGGEEFGVVLPETPIAGAEEVARRIVTTCRGLDIPTPRGHVTFSCSVGVAEATETDGSVEDVMRRADSALYEAKNGGRDGWKLG